ncbi:Xylose isomerase domain-containing protein TIM barrel [Spirochaeta thermophila DSM 6578]|uniref:Xylose isomerase domain-containing protein TIM barrel n=1 Tax=Winmispira thermophila (strain ATCC 700085 / DSM 6578 / Z-1203) TaxID=869211 RepID=G0GEJ6_WINT7|nr:sugar phosphate isomerase/epimerase family protein [Spirochaeta thermophila]AEJ60684.1 Xylose isomerase domain-containing protein TIM barrel [Spirochaeta thermophila DSM 6578]
MRQERLNLGIRLHDVGRGSPRELAARASRAGYRSVHLALHKAFEGFPPEPGLLSPGFARFVRRTFEEYDLEIAVLGCYINPIHPDPRVRETHIQHFLEHIRYARDFGCSIVATETGSRAADCSFHPETRREESFSLLLSTVGRLVEAAERYGVLVAIEPVADVHTIDTAEKMKRLLHMISSDHLKVLFDPVNIVPAADWERHEAIVSSAFELLKDDVVAVHVKDFVVERGKKRATPPGHGVMDFGRLFRMILPQKPYIHILAENIPSDIIDLTYRFLTETFETIRTEDTPL